MSSYETNYVFYGIVRICVSSIMYIPLRSMSGWWFNKRSSLSVPKHSCSVALARKLLMRGEDKKDNTSFRSVSACKHPQSEMPNLNQHGVTLCVKESACRYLTWGISLPARGRVTLSFSPFVFFLLPSLRFLLRLFLLFRLILLPFSPHFLSPSIHPSSRNGKRRWGSSRGPWAGRRASGGVGLCTVCLRAHPGLRGVTWHTSKHLK